MQVLRLDRAACVVVKGCRASHVRLDAGESGQRAPGSQRARPVRGRPLETRPPIDALQARAARRRGRRHRQGRRRERRGTSQGASGGHASGTAGGVGLAVGDQSFNGHVAGGAHRRACVRASAAAPAALAAAATALGAEPLLEVVHGCSRRSWTLHSSRWALSLALRAFLAWPGAPELALPGLEHLSPEQLFFVFYALNQCEANGPDVEQMLATKRKRTHGTARPGLAAWVNRVTSTNEDFARAFKCTPLPKQANPFQDCTKTAA
ncbi:uncharacterized protein LOC125946339 [Dermacentor silvarum]|uniref:uncharacterized protein LOC125946339 n=1 Tax=Dermacentor silvarum TaxID=543639 RepID=UPI0021014F43|nr:uncharacterized protein LOC125946339 [Dermacentor silvarum]